MFVSLQPERTIMKKDFKDRLGSCVKDLTGAEIKGITIDEEGGQVSPDAGTGGSPSPSSPTC